MLKSSSSYQLFYCACPFSWWFFELQKRKLGIDVRFQFKKLIEVETATTNSIIDIIAVIENVGILETFTGGSNKQTIYTKRDVFLVDPSMVRVIFTLWDDLAREFNGNRIQVIAIKNAIVTDYKGKKISAKESTRVYINPRIPEKYKIGTWYLARWSIDPLWFRSLSYHMLTCYYYYWTPCITTKSKVW